MIFSAAPAKSRGKRTGGRLFGSRRLNVVKRETVGIVTPGLHPGFLLSASGGGGGPPRASPLPGCWGCWEGAASRCWKSPPAELEPLPARSWPALPGAPLFVWIGKDGNELERERQNMSRFSIMKNWGINEITRWKVKETTTMTTGRKGTRSCGRSLQKRFLVKGWKCKPGFCVG